VNFAELISAFQKCQNFAELNFPESAKKKTKKNAKISSANMCTIKVL